MTLCPFRTVAYALCIEALLVSGDVRTVSFAEAQTAPGQSPLGVFREANKPPSSSQPQQQPQQQLQQPRPNVQPQGPQLGVFREANKPAPNQPPQQPQPKPQKPAPQRIDAPLGDPQWQPKDPGVSAPQGGAEPSMPSNGGGGGGMGGSGSNVPPMNNYQPPRGGGVFGAHNVPEPPAPEPAPNNSGLGSIAGIFPSFASNNGFGAGGGFPGGGGLGAGGLAGGALGGALLGGGIQGLFAGLNPNSIMQIAVGAGMLLSQMGQQQGQEQTSQKPPTPTPSPTVKP